MLDVKVKEKYSDPGVQSSTRIIPCIWRNIDIHYSSSVNGVAYLHTEILKNSELKPFYDLYPEKFNNKTNGITFRRWLLHCNHQLTDYISDKIGSDFKKDASKLEDLLKYKDDQKVLDDIYEIKTEKKKELAAYLKEKENVEIDVNSVFDVQVKRLHEYKRQQMNAFIRDPQVYGYQGMAISQRHRLP